MHASKLSQSWTAPSSSQSLYVNMTSYPSPNSDAASSSSTSPSPERERADDDAGDDLNFDRETWSAEGSPDSAHSDDLSDEDGTAARGRQSSNTLVSNPAHPHSEHSLSAPMLPKPIPTPVQSLHPRPARRPRGLSPLTPASTLPAPPKTSAPLPKSQPLSRALVARLANDVPHAGTTGGVGLGGKKKATGAQKLIVPTKAFRTTFELDLTASEFARR